MTLKALRVNRGMSQEEAAKNLGINVNTLVNYEKAKTFPDALMIKKIESLYKVKYDDIIFLPLFAVKPQ